MKLRIIIALCLLSPELLAQDSLFYITGFADVYYAYDFNKPADRNRSFTTQPYRHNEFNANWVYLQGNLDREKVRARVALHAGTYVQANYAHEPEILRNIYQAYVGFRIGKKTWIDAGIMPSYIGEESAVSMDNWNYSRNLSSDYSPYYQSGVQVTSQVNDKLTLKAAITNGFQLIRDNNDSKSIGILLEYKPVKNMEIGYSNYFGNDIPDDSLVVNGIKLLPGEKIRMLNDLYIRCKITNEWSISLTGEYNLQEGILSHQNQDWYAVVFKSIYFIRDDFSVAGRFEWYSDRNQVIVYTETENGFDVRSATFTINYSPVENAMIRLEGRVFNSMDKIFPSGDSNFNEKGGFVAASFAVRF